jgi:hypothetical protein
VVVDEVLVVLPAQAPTVSPWARCAATAGAAMLMVCELPLPVTWQTSTFSWPAPSVSMPVVVCSPDVDVCCPDVVVSPDVDVWPEVDVWPVVVVVPPLVVVEPWSVLVEEDCVVEVVVLVESVVLSAAPLVDADCDVIWARPTPAAAAKASPTATPTMERRLSRLNRFCTSMPFGSGGAWPYAPQSPWRGETCAVLRGRSKRLPRTIGA